MAKHSHNHVETYDGMIGFGLDRETDQNTIISYLQKFSDDTIMGEFSLLTRLLKKHLKDSEYHTLFLKDDYL